MPIKRRVGKGHAFDEYRAAQLLDGPDCLLFAGVGYLTQARWDDMPEAEQEAARVEMRHDWERNGTALTAWWNGNEAAFKFKPWVFVVPDPEELPWAATQFAARVTSEASQ